MSTTAEAPLPSTPTALAPLWDSLGITTDWAQTAVAFCALLTVALIALFICRRVLLVLVRRAVKKSKTKWDDALLTHKFFTKLCLLAPAVVFQFGIAFVPHISLAAKEHVVDIALGLMALTALLAINAFLSAVNTIYSSYESSKRRPIKGYLQILKIFVSVLGIVFIIATLAQQDPWGFLTAIGGMGVVLMLVFKDTILSLVASIQLTSNNMVQVGDWIEMPQFHADGDVIDIALHTVKVQNWDKTITTIPTHKLIETSFKNWRSMPESGGRRIKRSLVIDMNTIRFLTEEEIQRFQKFELLAQYINGKSDEIHTDNKQRTGDLDLAANKRQLTNIGTLRAYIESYLHDRADIHDEGLTFLIRQLQSESTGVPIEIYVFCTNTDWVAYEGIQSDIFDHLLAMVPEFGLRIFQEPSGSDFSSFTNGTA